MSSSKNNKKWKERVLEDFFKDEQITEESIIRFHDKIFFPKTPNDVPVRRERTYEKIVYKRSKIGSDKSHRKFVPKKGENSDSFPSKYKLLAEIDKNLRYLQSQRKYLTMGSRSCYHQLSSNDHEGKKREHCHEKCGENLKRGSDIQKSHVCSALQMLLETHCVKIADSCTQIESPIGQGVYSVKTNNYAQNVHLRSDTSSVDILWSGGNRISKECNIKMVNSSTQVSIFSKHCSDLRERIKMVSSSAQVERNLNKCSTKNASTSTRDRVNSFQQFELLSRKKHSSRSRLQGEINVHRSDETELEHFIRESKSPELPDFLNPNTQNDLSMKNINFSPKSKTSTKLPKSNSVKKRASLRPRSTNYSFHHKPISESREHLHNTEFRDNFSKERSPNPSAKGNFQKTKNLPGFSSKENHISSRPSSNDYSSGPRRISDSKKYLQSRKRENTFVGECQAISRNDEQFNKMKHPQISQTQSRQQSPSTYVNRNYQSPRSMYNPPKHMKSCKKQQNLSTTSKDQPSKSINKTYIKSDSMTHRKYPNMSNNLSTASTTSPNSRGSNFIDDRTYTIPDSDENEDYVILHYKNIQPKNRDYLYKSIETSSILESQYELAKMSEESQLNEIHSNSFTLQSKQFIESNATISGVSNDEHVNRSQLSQSPKMQTLPNYKSFTKSLPNKLMPPNLNKFYHNDDSENPKSKYQTSKYKSGISEKAPLTSKLQNVYNLKGNNKHLSISSQLQKYNSGQISSKSQSNSTAASRGKASPKSKESNSQIKLIISVDEKERARKKSSISPPSQPCNLGETSSISCLIAGSGGKPSSTSIKSDIQLQKVISITKNPSSTFELKNVYKNDITEELVSISPRLQSDYSRQMSSKSESCSIAASKGKLNPKSIKSDSQTHLHQSMADKQNLTSASGGKSSPKSIKPKSQLPANALITSNSYFYKIKASSSRLFPKGALGSPRSHQDDLSLRKDSEWETFKQKNDQTICPKEYSRLDTPQSDQSISPRSLQSHLRNVDLQHDNSLPVRGKVEAIIDFESDVILQSDKNSQKDRSETDSFIKEENNHDFYTVKPKLYASEQNITSPSLKSKRVAKSDLNLKNSPKQSETYVCASNSSPPSDISFNSDHSFQQKSSFDKLNHEKVANQNERDFVRSNINESNDMHSESEKQSIVKLLYKNGNYGTDNYEDTLLQTEKQRFVSLNIHEGIAKNIYPEIKQEIKQQIPASSKRYQNNMNGRHFVKSQSSTDCSNPLRTDEQSIVQPQNDDDIHLKDESLIETQNRAETQKGNDTELQDFTTYLQNRLIDCDKMVARQLAQYEPDREECLQRSGVKSIEKQFKTDSDQEEDDSSISLPKIELGTGNDYQINLKQEDFEESTFIFDDSERSCQFEEEDESTSYKSDIPSFAGCDCMKEGYYKIMQLAYY